MGGIYQSRTDRVRWAYLKYRYEAEEKLNQNCEKPIHAKC